MTQLAVEPIEFDPHELQAMHKYCLKYRDLVRNGGKPTQEQDDSFMLFQRACYWSRVAHGPH